MFKDHAKLKELKAKYKDEQVYVVPSSLLTHIKDGFTKEEHSKEIYSQFDNIGKFIFRYDAEGDSTFQQIIPYVVLFNPTTNKYYTYKRIEGSGEERLHGQLSLGFGGHIDATDGTSEVVFKGLVRELMEEVDYNNTSAAKFLGYVRDLQSATNDHTGLVFLLEVNFAEVKETDKYVGEWMTAEEMEKAYFRFEDWGKHIIDYIVDNKYKIK